MLTEYHTEICQRALGASFSPRARDMIIQANIAQDDLRGQIGHPEFHFDDNAFEQSLAYIEEQRRIVLDALARGADPAPAWAAFGRLTHTAQDFYAHSNYLRLWAEQFPQSELPDPPEVDALNPEISNHPQIRSGRIYFREVLAFIPALRPFTRRILPADAHAHMNLDYPERSPLFPYVIAAAVQRTEYEYRSLAARIAINLGAEALTRFRNRAD